ncbi:LuxR C-terminal-related transcriptional regulator [Microbacterium sp. Marseille-Q6965]|uniref:LuxR C-terminal-related transcriptional regulator n=1 Tax=Microbacterium sp. Marseille-Q6965 TaxID=2965072 RepID=UPI0021B83462|nr:LuxR C-terminal-related transcriptional regulator [Microbacterium sp. Marseille-Q6965]
MTYDVVSEATADTFHRAIARGDLESANRTVIAAWFDLFLHHPEGVRQSLSRVPFRRLRHYPLLAFLLGMVCHGSAMHRAKAMQYFLLGTRAAETRESEFTMPERILSYTAQSATLRISGRVGMAIHPARRAMALLDHAPEERERIGHLPRVYAQLGRTFIEAGLRDEALEALANGIAEADDDDAAGSACLSLMAGVEALEGDLPAAAEYLEAADRRLRDRLAMPYTGTFHRLAASMLAMEHRDLVTAAAQLDAVRPYRATSEHWVTIARVEGYLGLLRRQPAETLARLDRIPQLRTGDGLTRSASREIASITALLHLALGRSHVGAELLSRFTDARATVDRARVALVDGDGHGALTLVRSVECEQLSLRTRTEATAIEAAALLRLPAPHRNDDVVVLLGERLRHSAMRLPLALLPVSDFRAVTAALVRLGYADVCDGVEPLIPDRPIVRLTRRERAVLEAIALRDEPLVDIAARLHVSLNTVKSQLRGVYRKLEVDNRQDALIAAVERGLLRPAAEPAIA